MKGGGLEAAGESSDEQHHSYEYIGKIEIRSAPNDYSVSDAGLRMTPLAL